MPPPAASAARDGRSCPYCLAPAGSAAQQIDPPFISQPNTGLHNGCEAVCAVMMLQNAGIDLSAMQFVSWYLDIEPMVIREEGLYGPDPAQSYAGNPYSKRLGWGCFAPVIVSGLEQALADTPYQALDLSGMDLDHIVHTYVARSYPVAVWVVRNMREKEECYEWLSYDGASTYQYPRSQHCLLLVGHDALFYYFYDPDNVVKSVVRYEKSRVERSYASMGAQAVVIVPRGERQPAAG